MKTGIIRHSKEFPEATAELSSTLRKSSVCSVLERSPTTLRWMGKNQPAGKLGKEDVNQPKVSANLLPSSEEFSKEKNNISAVCQLSQWPIAF